MRELRAAQHVLAGIALLALCGCGESKAKSQPRKKPPATTAPSADPSATQPKIAGLEDLDQARADTMIDPAKVAARPVAEKYQHDGDFPAGKLAGLCYIPLDKPMARGQQFNQPVLYNFTGIRDPMNDMVKAVSQKKLAKIKGEVPYYQGLRKEKLAAILNGKPGDTRVRILGAVIKFLNVKKGPRGVLARTGYSINRGIMDQWNMRGQHFGSAISMQGERLLFCTYDRFPCDVEVIDSDGKRVSRHEVPQWTVDIEGKTWTVPAPKAVTSEPIARTGLYTVRCTRHPWQKGTLHVVDNPFCFVITRQSARHNYGAFSIPLLPAGKHTLEIWHPLYQPERKTIDVEILPSETTTIEIRFERPPNLFIKAPAP
ncbi:hypothetical protein LCGC14_1847220 [marine sediment metagenome]|uniref:Uncharacterized protein n=1 Tax=marine sediment metagenome TaxID=412755 RepID=A0A0F9GBN2_9ZZZZ